MNHVCNHPELQINPEKAKEIQAKSVQIYDCTLWDGVQREGIFFSLVEKLSIVKRLDQLGIHFIEGGWPSSNPKDAELFAEQEKGKGK